MEQLKDHERILRYWFGDKSMSDAYFKDRVELWFAGTPEIDVSVSTHTADALHMAERGELKEWAHSPRGCLALIILFDQCGMNIYRDSAKAFESSDRALPIAMQAIERGFDQKVDPIERVFYYLPLEHAEDLDLQKKSVALFEQLAMDSPEAYREKMRVFYDYAILHYEVIERFGRYPDRNELLGRQHTPEEAKYMAQGGPPF